MKVLPEGVEAAADALDPQRLARLVDPALAFDAELHALGPGASEEAVAQYLLVVDALNFCFWPDGPESSADDGQGGDEDSCPGEDEGSAAAAREQLEYEHLARGIKVRPGVEAAGQGRGCCLLAYRWRVARRAPPPAAVACSLCGEPGQGGRGQAASILPSKAGQGPTFCLFLGHRVPGVLPRHVPPSSAPPPRTHTHSPPLLPPAHRPPSSGAPPPPQPTPPLLPPAHRPPSSGAPPHPTPPSTPRAPAIGRPPGRPRRPGCRQAGGRRPRHRARFLRRLAPAGAPGGGEGEAAEGAGGRAAGGLWGTGGAAGGC